MIPYFLIEDFSIGPLTLYAWGFFIALAFLVGLVLAMRQVKKIGVSRNEIVWLVIFIYLGAIVGGRLFFILQTPLDFLRAPAEIFNTSDGGMMFYGGLFGGVVAGWLYLRRIKISPNPSLLKRGAPPFAKGRVGGILLNALAPIVPLAMAIGRIGCFLNNEHLGAITRVPWSILWPDNFLRHPVALYLILFDLALAGIIWQHNKISSFIKTFSFIPAFIKGGLGGILANPALSFLFLYPLGRFFLDFTRDVSADPHFFGLAASQWISLAVFFVAASAYYKNAKNVKIKV